VIEDRHFHWYFLAYDGEPDAQLINWIVEVQVIGYLSEADARVAAADIVTRQQYRLKSVHECSACGFNRMNADTFRKLASVK
jgi:hypothetical protein